MPIEKTPIQIDPMVIERQRRDKELRQQSLNAISKVKTLSYPISFAFFKSLLSGTLKKDLEEARQQLRTANAELVQSERSGYQPEINSDKRQGLSPTASEVQLHNPAEETNTSVSSQAPLFEPDPNLYQESIFQLNKYIDKHEYTSQSARAVLALLTSQRRTDEEKIDRIKTYIEENKQSSFFGIGTGTLNKILYKALDDVLIHKAEIDAARDDLSDMGPAPPATINTGELKDSLFPLREQAKMEDSKNMPDPKIDDDKPSTSTRPSRPR